MGRNLEGWFLSLEPVDFEFHRSLFDGEMLVDQQQEECLLFIYTIPNI
jgi:hypothetical protein